MYQTNLSGDDVVLIVLFLDEHLGGCLMRIEESMKLIDHSFAQETMVSASSWGWHRMFRQVQGRLIRSALKRENHLCSDTECGYNRCAVGIIFWIFSKVVFGAALFPKTTVGLWLRTSSMFNGGKFETGVLL
jgi:hypothetical protein